MKLPGRTEGAVQELSSVDPSAYAQRGQAIGGAMDAVQAIAKEWGEKSAQAAEEQAVIDYSNSMTEFETRWGAKRTFTKDEVAYLGVDVAEGARWNHWSDDQGKQHKDPKEEYNAEDVYPQALKKKMEGEAEARAQQIPGHRRRTRFLNHEKELINKRYVQAEMNAHIQREKSLMTQQELNIQGAEIAGNYPMAITMVERHPLLSREDKDAEIMRLTKAEESRYLSKQREHASDAELMQEIYRLTDLDSDGTTSRPYGQDVEGKFRNQLDKNEREAEVARLRNTLDAREADRKKASAAAKGAWWNDFYKSVDDPEITVAELMLEIDEAVDNGRLTDAQVGKARALAKGGAHETRAQNARYTAFRWQATSDGPEHRAAFADTLLGDFAGELSTDQLASLDKLQHAIKTDRSGFRDQEDMRKSALSLAGLAKPSNKMDEDDHSLIDQFDRAVDTTIAALETKEGRQATPMEIQKITDEATKTVLMTGRKTGGGWFGVGSKTLVKRGVPQEYIDSQYRMAAKYGRPMPSAEHIWDQWKARQ